MLIRAIMKPNVEIVLSGGTDDDQCQRHLVERALGNGAHHGCDNRGFIYLNNPLASNGAPRFEAGLCSECCKHYFENDVEAHMSAARIAVLASWDADNLSEIQAPWPEDWNMEYLRSHDTVCKVCDEQVAAVYEKDSRMCWCGKCFFPTLSEDDLKCAKEDACRGDNWKKMIEAVERLFPKAEAPAKPFVPYHFIPTRMNPDGTERDTLGEIAQELVSDHMILTQVVPAYAQLAELGRRHRSGLYVDQEKVRTLRQQCREMGLNL